MIKICGSAPIASEIFFGLHAIPFNGGVERPSRVELDSSEYKTDTSPAML